MDLHPRRRRSRAESHDADQQVNQDGDAHGEEDRGRGTFRLGFTILFAHWAMISYPSNVMKVSPIAWITPPKPLGRKSDVSEISPAPMRTMAATPNSNNPQDADPSSP